MFQSSCNMVNARVRTTTTPDNMSWKVRCWGVNRAISTQKAPAASVM